MDINNAKIIFKDYVSQYDSNDKRIIQKYEHSLRVCDLCKKIATYLNLSDDKILIAEFIGLLHDFGRFEQIKRYNTYNDRISVDHAKLGMDLLEEFGFDKFVKDKKTQEIIKIAVLNHNQTFIDDNLTEEELLFSQIIRDADKLDIFYIWKDMEFDKVEGKIDDKIYNRMLTCKYDYENINNKLDYYVLLIGFVYDINFSWTIRYLKENKYFNTIIDKVIEKNPHESFKLNKIKETINQYIESRDA